MPPVHFKLTKPDGHTRRVTFQELPTWHELVLKLQALYDVPPDNIGVSYIDNDNDEITASSNEELWDFYQTSHQPGNLIKFNVLDLSVPRDHAPQLPERPNANRNTFGQDNFDFPDSDWQRLAPFALADYMDPPSEGPHAFVEIIGSDVSGFAKDSTDSSSEGGQSAVDAPFLDKGKRRESSLGAASTTSVLNAELSQKFPVHVLDHASVKQQRPKSNAGDSQSQIAAQSTPKAQTANLTPPAQTSESVDKEDPPLPSLDFPQTNASSTLSNDIATLLNSFNNVISLHPELSEGVRNIVRNATTGVYWEAQRSALSRAVHEMQQPNERLDDESARRVSNALGTIFRSLSQVAGSVNVNNIDASQSQAEQNSSLPTTTQSSDPPLHPPHGSRRPWARRSPLGFESHFPRGSYWHYPPFEPPHGPPPGLQPPSGLPPFGLPPPPRPFPRNFPTPPPVPFIPPFNASSGGPSDPDPVPPIVPPVHEHHGGGQYGHHGHYFDHRQSMQATPDRNLPAKDPWVRPVQRPYPNPFFPPPFPPPVSQEPRNPSSKPNAQQLRSQLEEAKRAYKAQKEVYRREREERKKSKDARDVNASGDNNKTSTDPPGNITATSQAGPSSQIVSHAWGSYPQLEVYSIPGAYSEFGNGPRRSHTHTGHGSFGGPERKTEELALRTQSRIARRLADMGFSENSHPNLRDRIKAEIPGNSVISKEVEDNVVTTLLEELLAQGSKSPAPVASGSGLRGL